MRYSVVVPVYNRPSEVRDLLESLTRQTFADFEVIIVEDGSEQRCDTVVESFRDKLQVTYIYKENSGPGPSRNAGMSGASGNFLVLFDSDCIAPEHYLGTVEEYLATHPIDVWGGPDRASEAFTPLQRAVAYTMSSVLTTGGIRGGRAKGFQPRSFNMGISRTAFESTGGFRFDRFAEDIELSIRLKNLGFKTALIPEAFVYHRRRTSFRQFFRQAFAFGRGRRIVGRAHPGAVRLVHWLPFLFTTGLFALPFAWLMHDRLGLAAGILYAGYFLSLFLHSLAVNRHFLTAVLSVPAAVIQLVAYGLGFASEILSSRRRVNRAGIIFAG